MRGESVWRVAALPVLALVGAVATLAVSIDTARRTEPALHRVTVDRETIRALQSGAAVNDALLRSIIASWNNEMGAHQDTATPLATARSVVRAAAASPLWRADLDKINQRLAAIEKLPEDQQLPAIRDVHATFPGRLPVIERRLDVRSIALQNATGRRLALEDQFTVLTAKRAMAGIDPGPSSPMLRIYVSGLVAGQAPAPATLRDLLLERTSSPSVRAQLSALSDQPAVAPLAKELAWSAKLRGPVKRLSAAEAAAHPSYEALDAARLATAQGIERTIAATLDDVIAGTDHDEAELHATAARARYAVAVLGACVVLLVGWLLLRVRRSMNRLRRLAETDTLTSTLNRLGMRRRVEPWFADRAAGAVGLAVIDLDRFKSVNDTYGHDAGDQLLRTVSQRLTASTIPGSTAIARWGGDEYVVAFTFEKAMAPGGLEGVLDRIRRAIAAPVEVGDAIVVVSATIGAATCTCGSCDFDDLFRTADHALYVGKSQGRDRVASVGCGFDLASHFAVERDAIADDAQRSNDAQLSSAAQLSNDART